MSAESSIVLQELLRDELDQSPTTTTGLTNHLPMALVAKERLGANGAELVRFATLYSRRLGPVESGTERLRRTTWMSALGQRSATAELRSYFAREVAEFGVDETLRGHLTFLLPGVGGGGFHGVIRLAYALETGSAAQVAAGLAYFAEVAQPLGLVRPGGGVSASPEEILAPLSSSGNWSNPERAHLIDEEMHLVANREGFDSIVSSLILDRDSARRLAAVALRIYASTNDFTALHGVTGLDAVSVVRPWIEDQAAVDRFSFQALAAAYLSIGAPEIWSNERLDSFVGERPADVDSARAVAADSDDEHVAKLVYTALGGYERTGDPLYAAIAVRAATPGV